MAMVWFLSFTILQNFTHTPIALTCLQFLESAFLNFPSQRFVHTALPPGKSFQAWSTWQASVIFEAQFCSLCSIGVSWSPWHLIPVLLTFKWPQLYLSGGTDVYFTSHFQFPPGFWVKIDNLGWMTYVHQQIEMCVMMSALEEFGII